MANLIVPQQATPASTDASSLKPAHALPADLKTAGKSGKEILKDAKSASAEFDANLKDAKLREELVNGVKKEAFKKTVPQLAVNAQVQAPQFAMPKNAEGQLAANGKNGAQNAKKDLKLLQGAKENAKGLTPSVTAGAAGAQENALKALLDGKSEKAEPGKPGKTEGDAKASPKANNLTPLQQVMLASQTTASKAAVNPQAVPQGAVANADLSQAVLAVTGKNTELGHDFEVESIDAGIATATGKEISLNGKEAASEKRTPASKVSTSDFLDLRNLSQKNNMPFSQSASGSSLDLGTAVKAKDVKKDKFESLTGKEAFAGTLASQVDSRAHVKTIDAPVTQGTTGKNILSHDAIHQMTQSVNLLSQARQDGEIKIRLRPDHLGELHMSVKTQGQQVSLEIKAQNNESKKIIEESLASLKDSLGQQNLTLARVDVVNAPSNVQSAADQGMQMDMSQFRQNSGQNSNQGSGFDQGSARDLRYEEMSAPVNLNAARVAGINARAGQGLDLIA